MVPWKMQARLPQTVEGELKFSSHRKSQVAVSKMRRAIHQQILSVPPSNWTSNLVLLTPSAAIIPDRATYPFRSICLDS